MISKSYKLHRTAVRHRPLGHLTTVAALGRVLGVVLVTGLLITPNAAWSATDFSKGMHVVMTGTGSAFPDPERGGASVAVIVDGVVLQFDFGRGVMDNQMLAGINPVDVDYVFLTHHHFDHIATYDYFVISMWIAARHEPIHVFGPPGTRALHDGALRGMHESDYDFVKFIRANWPARINRKPAEEPPFVVADVSPGLVLDTGLIKVTAVSTPHYPNDKMSLAYRVDSKFGSVVISGDTGPSQAVVDLAKDADILIHELMKPDPGMLSGGKFAGEDFQKDANTDLEVRKSDRPQTGHTAPTELGKLADAANVGMVIAYHLPPITSVDKAIEMSSLYTGPRVGDDIWSEMTFAVKKQFQGNFILAYDGLTVAVGNED